ncbi:competence protein CoiA family protein [Lyngbya sp. CCY1209]|uniref:competence protein CoiA n=1 Tax=Lyngbya sp. CCY1209 TaxID=2886103 RepID=UPI002D204840|nr:competence protein CoiA family protein [Lyngbya sp. CCY1209]MEB3886140.1 hypothetical protein [Lyngbya sp. CCY1209]
MPLRAILDGRELLAPLLSDEEWNALKRGKAKVTLPCCEARGYLRTSTRGIKHFVHQKKGECTSKPETWQHRLCKTEIARACQAMGYDVKTEASGENWRADVLATKQIDGKLVRVAFEVQWSHQTLEETERRQRKYAEDGIQCYWLFKKFPTSEPRRDIPMFQLSVNESEQPLVITDRKSMYSFSTADNRRSSKLSDFIADILSGYFKFCESYRFERQQKIRIRFFPVNCWKCRQKHYIYHIQNQPCKTRCGEDFDLQQVAIDPQFLPEIVAKARECLETPKAKRHKINMGAIKPRYSKTVGDSYTSFGCPRCGAIFGNHFYFDEICNLEYEETERIDFATIVDLSLEDKDIPHWCYSRTRHFCCSPDS